MIVKKNTPANFQRKIQYGQPLFEGTFQCAEYITTIKTNSEGFRDTEHNIEKPKGFFRILILGDSFTYGLGVEAEQTYPKVLEKILNDMPVRKEVRYEVFNMGIAGIGTLEEREILKYAIKYKPDLVFLGLFVENRWNLGNGNDLCDNFKTQGQPTGESLGFKPRLADYLNSFQRFLAAHSELYFILMTKGGTFFRRNLVGIRQGRNMIELEKSWDITQQILKQINIIAKDSRAKFAIVRIPFLYDVYNNKPDRVSEILVDFSKANKINICNLLDFFRGQRHRDLYYPADGHWKALAHKLAAEEIFRYLIEKNLLFYNN
ncbi:MAG: SGNH/GDSL hydrolase family protein [Candidatus Omnitrophota bacterium]